MISVTEAKQIINANKLNLPAVKLPLEQAAYLLLAEDVFADVDIPAFPQSSMDGYTFAFADWQHGSSLTIHGEIPAGQKTAATLHTGQAMRIFTGAPLPAGADTVVMQEKVIVENGKLSIQDESLRQGNNVRPKGSAIKAKELALAKNTLLTPAAAGFLAGIGCREVYITPAPSVSIVITGNELRQPGEPLQYGEVYESNSYALTTALQQLGITQLKLFTATDDIQTTIDVLQEALSASDMVLLTGGVSVGDYDFVVHAAEACGVRQLFHRIKQRPGKPLYAGKKENKLVFGLPGNPSSVLTCFYEYVLPALGRNLVKLFAPLEKAIQKPAGLTCFLKAFYNGKTVLALGAQESFRMSSFAVANCLVQVNEGLESCAEDDLVELHLLPL